MAIYAMQSELIVINLSANEITDKENEKMEKVKLEYNDNGNRNAFGSNIRQKLYCQSCGTRLDYGARFCKGCGIQVEQVRQAETENIPPKEESFSHKQHAERKTVYEGQLHKCPNCGELLDAFISHCPCCGYEIRDARSSSSVRELAHNLDQIESERMTPIEEKKSLMKMVFGKDLKKDEDEIEDAQERFDEQKQQRKANLIINFSVPNTREDILEFMILASSNINIKKSINDEVTKAWISKLDQVYEKAKLLMGGKSDFDQIKDIYDCQKAQIKRKKYKGYATTCFGIGVCLLLMGFCLFKINNTVISIILLLVGIVILIVGVKIIFTCNKNDKLNL